MTDPMNLNDVLRDICRLQADLFRAEAKAGLEFRTLPAPDRADIGVGE